MDGPPSLPSPLLLGALDAARRGWRAFPLHWLTAPGVCSCPKGPECKGSAGKHPLHGGWQESATTDPERLLATWAEYPHAHVGITTGRGLVVLDVDPRHDGPATLARLCAEHGQLPETFTVESGSGGWHHYFRTTETLPNTSGGKILPGLDTRGERGLVVYPPSPHLSGGTYQILRDVPLAPFPTWLRDRVYGVTPGTIAARIVASGKKPATTIPTTFEDGDRDNLVMRLAASLRAKGMDEEEIFAGLLVPNERRCKPPLPEVDLRRIAASMAKYAPGTAARVKKPVLQEAPPAVEPAPGDPPVPDDWVARLTTTERNGVTVPDGTIPNLVTALGHHPAWAGILRHNTFQETTDVCGVPPWHPDDAPAVQAGEAPRTREWADADDTRLVCWAERECGIRVRPAEACAAVALISRRHPYHPVRDYLDGLTWDHVPRLGIFLAAYFGASGQPPAYLAAIGSKWLISAVARIYRPGVQADHVPILEGLQGAGKTQSGAALVPDPGWFCTLSQTAGDLESMRAIRRVWVVELGELDALSRAEVSRIKRFLSESSDNYRDPYERRARKYPRQNVFIGTINAGDAGYLRDTTGNRRFWPVACGGVVDVAGIARDRDQLWAEARDLFRAGVSWWPGRDETELLGVLDEEQRERLTTDPWENHLNAFLSGRLVAWAAEDAKGTVPPGKVRGVTMDELLGAVGKPRSDWTHADEIRAGAIAKRALWTSFRPRGTGGIRVRMYVPPVQSKPPGPV